jgi:hypothetical protein
MFLLRKVSKNAFVAMPVAAFSVNPAASGAPKNSALVRRRISRRWLVPV